MCQGRLYVSPFGPSVLYLLQWRRLVWTYWSMMACVHESSRAAGELELASNDCRRRVDTLYIRRDREEREEERVLRIPAPRTHTLTHAQARTHARAHTHTHTHIHAYTHKLFSYSWMVVIFLFSGSSIDLYCNSATASTSIVIEDNKWTVCN